MRTAIVAALFAIGAPTFAMEDRLLTDFDKTTMQWYSVNDGVMGGRSSGSFQVTDGKLRFSGVLNTNGGGFASIRTRSRDLKLGGTMKSSRKLAPAPSMSSIEVSASGGGAGQHSLTMPRVIRHYGIEEKCLMTICNCTCICTVHEHKCTIPCTPLTPAYCAFSPALAAVAR